MGSNSGFRNVMFHLASVGIHTNAYILKIRLSNLFSFWNGSYRQNSQLTVNLLCFGDILWKHRPAVLNSLWSEAQTEGYRIMSWNCTPWLYVPVTHHGLEFSINWICSMLECLPRIWYLLFQTQKFDLARVLDWTILMILTHKLNSQNLSFYTRRPDMPSIYTFSSKWNIIFMVNTD